MTEEAIKLESNERELESPEQFITDLCKEKDIEIESKYEKFKPYKPRCKCKYCDSIFQTHGEANLHEKNCDKRGLKYICNVCNQLFKHESGLKKHELRHKPPGGFICSECNERFLTDTERLLHKETVHEIFKCRICAEKFTSGTDYLGHIAEKHGGRDREYVVCTDCGAQFRQHNQLKLHNASLCGTLRSFTCEKCGSKFMNQNTLNVHMSIHVGEKKHLCNFCGNSYLSRGQLKNHERSHTGEKPFKCNICNKAFSHRESLVTHSSLHTGVKPYLCENCGSRFSCIGNLIKHRKARPHTCGLPQFCKNTKCAPRASSKNVGSLTTKKIPKLGHTYSKRKGVNVPELLEDRKELTSFESIKSETESNKSLNENKTAEPNGIVDIVKAEPEDFSENPLMILTPKISLESVTQPESDIISSSESLYDSTWTNQTNQEQQLHHIQFNNDSSVTYNLSEVVFVINNEHVYLDYQESQSKLIDLGKITLPEENGLSETKELIIVDSNKIEQHEVIEDLSEVEIKSENNFSLDDSSSYVALHSPDDNNHEIDDTDEDHISDTQNWVTPMENDEMYQCSECPGQFKYQKSFLKHLEAYHNQTGLKMMSKTSKKYKKSVHTCQYCGKIYTSEKLLSNHTVRHGDDGSLVHRCSCCPRYFATSKEMHAHQLEDHKSKLTCHICSKTFKDLECISSHIRYVHKRTVTEKKKYEYVCTKCGKKFNSRVAMSDHERADCGRSPIYKCSYCNKFYHSAGSLKTHQLIHSGDLPHLCNYCGKGFRTQGQVKVHQRSHSGEKPFQCSQCPKSFAHRESLLTHSSIHTGLKRFMCQGCGSRFSCISNLQAHRRSHKMTCGLLPSMTKAVGADGNVRESK